MKILTKHVVILISVCGIISCTRQMTIDLWNSIYSERTTVKEYKEKEKAYYDKESYAQKELREKNISICLKLTNSKYPNPNFDSKIGILQDSFYKKCMKERGSPVYLGE